MYYYYYYHIIIIHTQILHARTKCTPFVRNISGVAINLDPDREGHAPFLAVFVLPVFDPKYYDRLKKERAIIIIILYKKK